MNKTKLQTALADYIASLEASASQTHRAEDRGRYERHLAAAALMFAAIEKRESIEKLKELVASERRSYGWDYLSDQEGATAESAFDTFAKLVELAT